MKQACFLLVIGCLAFASCKKEHKDPLGNNYPSALNTILTPAVLSLLQSHGMTVNAGLTPPTINGIYLLSLNYCIYDDSGGNTAGSIYDNYKLRFTNQNNTAYTIAFDYKDINNIDVGGANTAIYITGTGNAFTVFAQSVGSESGIEYTMLNIVSGTIQGNAIKSLQLGTYLVSKKGDPANTILEPVGSTRIFKDQDGTSEYLTTY